MNVEVVQFKAHGKLHMLDDWTPPRRPDLRRTQCGRTVSLDWTPIMNREDPDPSDLCAQCRRSSDKNGSVTART